MESSLLGVVLDSSVLIAAVRRGLTPERALENVRQSTGEVALVLSAMQLPRSATVFIAQGRSGCANDVAGFLTS